jgi:hypothetical protein
MQRDYAILSENDKPDTGISCCAQVLARITWRLGSTNDAYSMCVVGRAKPPAHDARQTLAPLRSVLSLCHSDGVDAISMNERVEEREAQGMLRAHFAACGTDRQATRGDYVLLEMCTCP